ncbi:MAG: dihydroorotate dehydrogenase electron transfer subunit [Chlorobium sp.]
MCIKNFPVDSRATLVKKCLVSNDVNIITFDCPAIAATAKPGNFVNIKVNNATQPLLRRPFSIHNVQGSLVEVMVKSIGHGTALLSNTPVGVEVMMLGPLGNSFDLTSQPFDIAVLVSGGIGTAPMLFLEKTVAATGKEVIHLVGGRTKNDLLIHALSNCRIATDDGSAGLKGNVVVLLHHELPDLEKKGHLKIFACGTNAMLKALAEFCREHQLPCDLSLESVMGCGIGICYGCSTEVKGEDGKSKNILLCREGTVINSKSFAN